MGGDQPRRRRRRRRRGLGAWWYRLRQPGSPNLWLIVPLFVVSVLLVAYLVGTLMTSDLSTWARDLVRKKSF
jgi:hypothetical protein